MGTEEVVHGSSFVLTIRSPVRGHPRKLAQNAHTQYFPNDISNWLVRVLQFANRRVIIICLYLRRGSAVHVRCQPSRLSAYMEGNKNLCMAAHDISGLNSVTSQLSRDHQAVGSPLNW